MGGRGHLRVRPHGHARAGVLGRHPAADGVAARCTSGTCSATPTPTSSPASSACAASTSSTRWAGTTTACPPSAACRTTTACAASRACRTTRTSPPPEKPGKQQIADLAQELRRALRDAHRRGREGVRGAVAPQRPVGRLVARLPDHRRPGPRDQPARVPAQRRARPGLRVDGADAVGRHVPHRRGAGRARGPRAHRRVAPASPIHGADGTDVFIETTRPELHPGLRRADRAPRRRALPAAVRHDGALAAVRRRGARCSRTRPPRSDRGAGIAMCCTFGDLTDVQWWRELELPNRTVINRDGRLAARDARVDHVARAARQRYEELAGATVHTAKERIVAHAHRDRRARRRRPSRHAPGEVLREGRQAARDRLQPPVVHPQRRPGRGRARRDDRPRPGAAVAPGLHAPPLRGLGARPQRRLAGQPPALLRGAGAGLVPARRRRRGPARRGPDARPTTPCPSTRRPTSRPASPPTSATCRAASPATATSSTPGRRRR